MFGARPYGRAESNINFDNATKEAYLAGKIRIVAPESFTLPGESKMPAGPSALLVCAYQVDNNNLPVSPSTIDYLTQCEKMDWLTTLVFSDDVAELGGSTSLRVEAAGAGSDMPFYTAGIEDFLAMARTESEYNNLKGLYIISFQESNDIPIIRALNLENSGFIQNEGIIDIGDRPAGAIPPKIKPNDRTQDN